VTAGKAVPLYQRIKDYVAEHIDSGAWGGGARVPSEHELVRRLGASRMTVNRALRELAADGRLRRVQGVGTFVADARPQLELLTIRNIADEIRERGHRYANLVHAVGSEPAAAATAKAFGLSVGAPIFHSVLVHFEDGVAVQLEDRYVNPVVAPDYLEVDFARTTPNEYLMRAAPLAEVEHILEAVLPDALTRRLLRIGAGQPCLLLRRRTWSGGHVASVARLIHPSNRYRLGTRFRAGDGPPAPSNPDDPRHSRRDRP